MREQEVSLALFTDWLARDRASRLIVEDTQSPDPDILSAVAASDSLRLAVEAHPLLPPSDERAWIEAKENLERELSAGVTGSYALWLPPGADLPAGEDERAHLSQAVGDAAGRLEPGGNTQIELAIDIYLKKASDEGGLVSVTGGLNKYWARLTEGVQGTFDLDSRRLHRLPESAEHLDQLVNTIWKRARTMEQLGEWVAIETIDAWTLSRLGHGEGVTIIGRPPQALADANLSVRRNLRRILAAAGPRLRDRDVDARALVVTGFYTTLEDEGASIAMRGYDPPLYSGLDFVCMAADGRIKMLMETPSPSPRWA